ncbi:hypothetical protein [Streptomyces sp. NPDC050504]|uniref:hypothetical protein n=1 Tax=Streptomyces sp. NPDC050504 TaxID=3365618 RepID=UPI0037990C92
MPDRKEAEVRRLLEGRRPAVPADLTSRATELGTRLLRRRRAVRVVFLFLLAAAVIAFAVWAAQVEPWVRPPMNTTPPLEEW